MLSIELESRVFGGGVLEILPGDFKNIRIPKLNKNIDFKEIAQEVDKMLRSSVCVEDIVPFVDNKIRNYINFSDKELKLIYDNWIELKSKRMDK